MVITALEEEQNTTQRRETIAGIPAQQNHSKMPPSQLLLIFGFLLAFCPQTSLQQQCNANFTRNLCSDLGCPMSTCGSDWGVFGDYSYKAFAISGGGTFFQGSAICQQNGAKIASVHSAAENQFIADISASFFPAQDPAHGLWLGLHRFQPSPPNGATYCIWDDGTACDFGATNVAGSNVAPWVNGPSSTYSTCTNNGFFMEDCVNMYNSNGNWNDINCYQKMPIGVVCKKQCTNV